MLPQCLVLPLREHLGRVRQLWAADMESGHAGVELPYALERKYPRPVPAGMVLGLRSRPSFHRSAQRRRSPAPSLRRDLSTRVQARGSGCWHRQAGDAAHAAPLLCDPSAAGRKRHPHRARVARARRRGDNDDLHTRAEDGRRRRAQPSGLPADYRVAAKRTLVNFHKQPGPDLTRRCDRPEPRLHQSCRSAGTASERCLAPKARRRRGSSAAL